MAVMSRVGAPWNCPKNPGPRRGCVIGTWGRPTWEVVVELGHQQEAAACTAVLRHLSLSLSVLVRLSLSLSILVHLSLSFSVTALPRTCPAPASPLPFCCTSVSTCCTRSPARCCLAPASAAKFPEAVLAAGLTPEPPEDILALERKETRCTPMRRSDDWVRMLRDTIEDVGRRRGVPS